MAPTVPHSPTVLRTPYAAKLPQGAVRSRHRLTKDSQAHPGVAPLNPVTHRNVSYQPLPRALGLAPYHYSLADNFAEIAANIGMAKKMTFHVLGDSGGVQDGEFQNYVAEQMIAQLDATDPASPQFCYHVGDVVYFTGMHDDYLRAVLRALLGVSGTNPVDSRQS